MNNQQSGFGGLQVLMVVAAIGAVSLLAVPKYNAAMTKAKITEAFTLAGASKQKLSQFYMVNNRFPRSAGEANAMNTVTLSPPEYVEGMAVEPNTQNHEIVVKVFLKDGVVENLAGGEQFIYIAGDTSTAGNSSVVWSCGAVGVDAALLPENCQS